VSQAGTADAISSRHVVASLGEAALLHAGRPTVVTVGVGATAVGAAVIAPSVPIASEVASEVASQVALEALAALPRDVAAPTDAPALTPKRADLPA
jgi:uroporphyrin-III C-methyltransferase